MSERTLVLAIVEGGVKERTLVLATGEGFQREH